MTKTADIDALIESYDVANDALLATHFTPITARLQARIHAYAADINGYGDVMAQHLMRTSTLGAAFITDVLGFSAAAGRNFYAANLLHDLGKTHHSYTPDIWQTPHRPTQAEREEKRAHTRLGVELLDMALTKSPAELQTHPHIRVAQSLQQHHHERVNGMGYEGLSGDAQGQIIKAICIIDAYDGDMLPRGHLRDGRTPQECLTRLKTAEKYADGFDAKILEEFINFIENSNK